MCQISHDIKAVFYQPRTVCCKFPLLFQMRQWCGEYISHKLEGKMVQGSDGGLATSDSDYQCKVR